MIADDVLRALPDHRRENIRRALSSATFVRVQNVAEYYFAGTPQEVWSIDDFPRIVSPWPTFWMEFHTPPELWFEATGRIRIPFRRRWGILGNCVELEAETSARQALKEWATAVFPDEAPSLTPGEASPFSNASARWLLHLDIFSPGEGPNPLVGSIVIAVAPDGRGGKDNHFCVVNSADPGEVEAIQGLLIAGPRDVVLLTMSFANCRNVELVGHRLSTRLLRKRTRRERVLVMKYYTLEIRPMAQLLRHAMEQAGTGLKRALHLCRGHFKDYRDGAGLFGRHRGLYWWDLHARGSASAGEIRKDYAVRPSLENTHTPSPHPLDPNMDVSAKERSR